MGVACHIPSSIACDRVGLAVWLARRAAVTAQQHAWLNAGWG